MTCVCAGSGIPLLPEAALAPEDDAADQQAIADDLMNLKFSPA